MILLLKTQLLELTGPKLLELCHRLGAIGEQVQAGLGIDSNFDCTIVNPVINPVRLDSQALGDLGDRQVAGDLARVGLTAVAEQAMAQAQGTDGARQDDGVFGRAIPATCQGRRDFLVGLALVCQLEDLLLHGHGRGQPGQGPDRHRQECGRRVTSSPDDPDM